MKICPTFVGHNFLVKPRPKLIQWECKDPENRPWGVSGVESPVAMGSIEKPPSLGFSSGGNSSMSKSGYLKSVTSFGD